MKTKLLLLSIATSLFISHFSYGQAAGNSISNGSFDESKTYQPPMASRGYQQQYNPTYAINNDSTINIDASVLMNVKADSYLAIFGVSQIGSSIDSANTLMNNRINSFIANLNKLGIMNTDIYVDLVSQIPIFTIEVEKKLFSKSYNEVPAGFELRKNVHIKYSKSDMLDKILIEGARNEIYDIVKVDYFINNFQPIYDTLRKLSVTIISKKAEAYAKLGIKFNPSLFTVVDEDINSSYPIEHYKSYSAFSDASSNFIRKKALNSPGYTPAAKPLTVYYSKQAYNKYDEVINPVVIEPEVQFSFYLKLKYTLKRQ